MVAWEFGVLGPLTARRDGTLVGLSAAKQRIVLATLALRVGEVVPVDHLVAALWDERAPSGARQTCQAYAMRLRQALGDQDAVVTRHGGYLLDVDPERVDHVRFTSLVAEARGLGARERAALLRRALELWRGPALADVPSEALHRDEVPALAEQRLSALELRIQADIELGGHAEVIGELRALTAEHPFREGFWGDLMLALYRSSRQADALQVYRELDDTLAEELGLRPGERLRQLHDAVLRNDPSLDAAPAPVVAAPTRVSTVARTTLPPDIGDFVGRAEEVRLAGELLTTRGAAAPIVVLSGPPGVGKSALAVHVAHRLRPEFPGGILHVNLLGYSTAQTMGISQALRYFLRACDVPAEQIPLDQDDQEVVFQTLLTGKRVLLVLDNAAHADQVRRLLPAEPSCAVLVTSRSDLRGLTALQGARRIPVDVLAEREARALVAGIVGAAVDADPVASAELTTLCGRLPLALRIAAANLSSRPVPDVADYVSELRRDDRIAALAVEGDESAAVEATFVPSYRALKPEARRLFRLLGLTPGADFTVPAAAALLRVPFDEATRLVEQLAAASLVQQNEPRRYQFHDLLRLYAGTIARDEEDAPTRERVLRRLYEHYLHTADAAAELLNPTLARLPRPEPTTEPAVPHLADEEAAAAWFDAERANLVAVIEQAVAVAPEFSWHLTDAVRGYLHSRRLDADLLTATNTAIAATEASDARVVRAWLHNSRGTLHWSRGDYPAAIADLTEALAGHRAEGERRGESSAVGNLGIVHLELGELRTAVGHARAALAICREIGDPRIEAATLVNLGAMHLETANLADARKHLTEALALADRWDLTHTEATARNNLGGVCLRQGDIDEALAHHQAALAIYHRLRSRHDEAEVLQNLAATYREAGRLDEAVEHCRRALTLAEQTRNLHYEADALNTLASIELRVGHRASALAKHTTALRLSRDAGYRQGEITALIGLGAHHRALGAPELARAPVQEALALAERTGFRLREGQALVALAGVELDLGQHATAAELAGRALDMATTNGDTLGQTRARRVLDALANDVAAATPSQ
ncbi:DNA-binding transcriptional activator of the SARP family [Actinokineospora globicatena]|nr:DNA-binding transcriptional activator of the SARP family [Actinokineospora globicatena]GLW79901.1 SARP family transcriptional regulator [Actinokineospora globicatena]GLW85689.1 SARP family transcriptional regulator [Actinokineospora globicatena]